MVDVAWVNVRLELVEGAEVLVDGRRQRAVGLVAAVGALVLPEDGVQDVTRDVEGERLLEPYDGAEVVLVACSRQLLERLVCAGHVGGVVLVVVELHDLGRHVGLQRGCSRRADRGGCTRPWRSPQLSSWWCVLDHTRRGGDPNREATGVRVRAGGRPQRRDPVPATVLRRYACRSEHGPERPLARPRLLHP